MMQRYVWKKRSWLIFHLPTRLKWVGVVVTSLCVVLLVSCTNPGGSTTTTTEPPLDQAMCLSNPDCHDVLEAGIGNFPGIVNYGIEGTWNRANLQVQTSSNTQAFVDSEMWDGNSGCTNWVEEGIADGYKDANGTTHTNSAQPAYQAFYAYEAVGGEFNYYEIAAIAPAPTTTDNYEISLDNGQTQTWLVQWDGTQYTTPNMGYSSSNCAEIGGEVLANEFQAGTFNMYSQLLGNGYTPQNWGNSTDIYNSDTGAFTDSFVSGGSGGNEFSWSTLPVNNALIRPPGGQGNDTGPSVTPETSSRFAGTHPNLVSHSPEACSMTAAWSLPANPKPGDIYVSKNFPPASVPPTGWLAQTLQNVVLFGQQVASWFGNTPPAPSVSKIGVQQMSWSDLSTLDPQAFSPDSSHVAPSRCVWVVSINAPIQTPSPQGVTPKTPQDYTAVVDASTGALIAVATGVDVVAN